MKSRRRMNHPPSRDSIAARPSSSGAGATVATVAAAGAAEGSLHLSCPTCEKQFGRREHLERHNLVHLNERAFNCSQCSKSFSRRYSASHIGPLFHLPQLFAPSEGHARHPRFTSDQFSRDALQRHEATHQRTEPNLVQKRGRACQNCHTAKARCSGGIPCGRCQQRILVCRVIDMPVDQASETVSRNSYSTSNGAADGESTSQLVHWETVDSLTSGGHDHQRHVAARENNTVAYPGNQPRHLSGITTPEGESQPTMLQTAHPAGSASPKQVAQSRSMHAPRRSSSNNGQAKTPNAPLGELYETRPRRSFHAETSTILHTEHRSSFHNENRPTFTPDARESGDNDHQAGGKSAMISVVPDAFVHDLRSTVVRSEGTRRDPQMYITRDSELVQTLHHSASSVYDVDIWNTNPASTINWLAEPYSDFDHAVEPLPMSESVYLNNLPQLAFPMIPHQLPGSSTQHMDDLPPELFERLIANTWPNDRRLSQSEVISDDASGSIHSSEARGGKSAGSGQFYVDNESGLLPRTKRRKVQGKPPTDKRTLHDMDYSLRHPLDSNINISSRYEIPSHSFEYIYQAFQTTCITPGVSFQAFPSPYFPPKNYLEYLISLYFKWFQPQFPMLHVPTFEASSSHWLHLLALATIGSHYVEAETSEVFAISLHEVLRRVLVLTDEIPSLLPGDEVVRAQIKLLHTVGALYGGDDRLQRSRSKLHQDLIVFCEGQWQLGTEPIQLSDTDPTGLQWKVWAASDIRSRTGYCIWLLDCIWASHTDRRPSLNLDHAKPSLPSNERLWAIENAQDWKKAIGTFSHPRSLLAALQSLYVEKNLSAESSEFSRILMIYGIFQRSWEVESYFKPALSRYEPTTRKDSSRDLNLGPAWLPSVPTFAKWRNSACDCLDILHWSANATYMGLSGVEHPTIVHLHVSRVVLLTPCSDIIKLAQFSVQGAMLVPQSQMLASEQEVRKWATQDQYKARLAVAHAGMLLWHLRRFSVNAFYEPVLVAKATLVLWAFSTFRNKPLSGPERDPVTLAAIQAPQDTPGDLSDSEDPGDCDIILLDRPTDDELKRDFVRRGQSMVPNLAGVGSLYGDRAPERILEEGRKLLYSLNCWGIRRSWIVVLDGLLDLTRKSQK